MAAMAAILKKTIYRFFSWTERPIDPKLDMKHMDDW